MKNFVLSIADTKFEIYLLHVGVLFNYLTKKYKPFISTTQIHNSDVKLYFLFSNHYFCGTQLANNLTFSEEKGDVFFRLKHSYCGKYSVPKREGYFIIPAKREFFNTIMRIILALVDSKRILLLHAASVVKNKKGLLLIGLPETGKTTISKKYPPESVLSDELSILVYENGKYYLYSSPFHSDDVKPSKLHKKVELYKVYLLTKYKLNKTEIANYILKNVVFSSRESYKENLKHVKKILYKFSPLVVNVRNFLV